MSSKEIMMAGGGSKNVYVEDVFSTYLYTGTSAAQTITNNIDLAGEGGMVWMKSRSSNTQHAIQDSVRGLGGSSFLNSTLTGVPSGGVNGITAFNSNGFTLGVSTEVNAAAAIFTSWTFRKAPNFFDVVTYLGTGVSRNIAHNLGSVPGCIIIKRTDLAADWQVYHRSLGNTDYLTLNTTFARVDDATKWNNTTPTSTVFRLGSDTSVNASGGTYVAYVFAHNAPGFGDSGAENVISCGSYVGNGTVNPITLNWEPQFVLLKKSSIDGTGWRMYDNLRGMSETLTADLSANSTAPENSSATSLVTSTASGFKLSGSGTSLNSTGDTFIYIAIRRGPMKTPTLGTSVFQPTVYTGTNTDNRLVNTTIAPDMVFVRQRDENANAGMVVGDRLRGQPYFVTGAQAAEVNSATALDQQLVSAVEYGTAFSSMTGFYVGKNSSIRLNASTTANNQIAEAFKRAPGFFDAVCYTGNGTNQTIAHNLTVAPELIIVKRRDSSVDGSAAVYVGSVGNAQITVFTGSDTPNASVAWNSTSPTSSVFSVGYAGGNVDDKYTNTSAGTYVAYLFATCPGVSKVFSYTGNGTSQTINCGFTTGARFVLIKRTDTTGDWYVWDSARGIVAGNDPHLSLNTTAAEVTTDDSVDTDTTGFIVNQLVATNVNVNLGTYIGLAIA